MKKFYNLFLALITVVTIISCSSDSNEDVETTGLIVGKWQLYQEGETIETLKTPDSNGCSQPVHEFYDGGMYIERNYFYDETEQDCTFFPNIGKWYKKGNLISIKDNYDTSNVTILELTETTLKVKKTDAEGDWISVFTKVPYN